MYVKDKWKDLSMINLQILKLSSCDWSMRMRRDARCATEVGPDKSKVDDDLGWQGDKKDNYKRIGIK